MFKTHEREARIKAKSAQIKIFTLLEDKRWVLEDGAQRPPSYYDLPRQSHEFFTFHFTMSPSYYD